MNRGNFVIRRGSSNTVDRDAEFKTAVDQSRLIIYVDEWSNKRTMEARAYGIAQDDRRVLIGFQIDADRGIVPAQLWKAIDDLDRVIILPGTYESVPRTIPPQYSGQVSRYVAVANETALDLTKHEAEGY